MGRQRGDPPMVDERLPLADRAEMGDGSSEAIGPGDLIDVEDLTGMGHVTYLPTDVTCLFLRMPAEFDFRAWLKG